MEKVDQAGLEKVMTSEDVDLKKTETVDTLHNDEALRVLAHYDGDQHWTEQEEKKLVRKIDRKLVTILCITYGLQYYDKAMLAQAVRISHSMQSNTTVAFADAGYRRFSVFARICISQPAIATRCAPLSSIWASS